MGSTVASNVDFLAVSPKVPLGDPDRAERLAMRQAELLARLKEQGPPSQWPEAPPIDWSLGNTPAIAIDWKRQERYNELMARLGSARLNPASPAMLELHKRVMEQLESEGL